MTDGLLKSMIMSLVRKGLVMLGTYVIATGAVSDVDWQNFVAGTVPILVGAIWSLVIKAQEAKARG